MTEAPWIVLAGGGTGGHLMPGLAVVQVLRNRAAEARFLLAGTGRELECRWAAEAGIDIVALPCRPLPHGPAQIWPFLRDQLSGVRAACRILVERPVRAVVGLGGFASAPMAWAAGRHGVPLVLLEQNVLPGRATRWFARQASAVCLSYEASRARLPRHCAAVVTGNPVRPIPPRPPRARPRLLVLGGSAGAQTLNRSVPLALARLRHRLAGWEIVHQTGAGSEQATRERYFALGLAARVEAFLADVPAELAAAELAISRGGGTTLAELTAACVPSVVVPYPHATNDHQRWNAEAFAAQGAGRVVDQRRLAHPLDVALSNAVGELLATEPRGRAVGVLAGRSCRDAAARVAGLVASLAGLAPGLPVPPWHTHSARKLRSA